MLVKFRCILFCVFALVGCAFAAPGSSISGRVVNQTVNKAAAGDDVILLRLGEGMQEVERTHTDAQGAFSFSSIVPDADYLVRVLHQGVNYDQKSSGVSSPLQISVYDAVAKISGLAGTMGIAQVESDGANLKITEMYAITNVSDPPVTQANAHNFEIVLPAKAALDSLQVKRAGGVWVNQTPAPLAGQGGRLAADFPLRPGDTLFKFVYHVPYQSGAALKVHLAYPVRTFGVVHPPSIVFKSSRANAFTSPGIIKGLQLEQLVSADMIRDVPAFRLSGVGVAPSSTELAQATAAAVRTEAPVPAPVSVNKVAPAVSNDGRSGEMWAILIAMSVLGGAGILFIVRARRRSSFKRLLDVSDLELSPAAALRDELSQLETEKLYGAISSDEYETAKQALSVSLQRAITRTQEKRA